MTNPFERLREALAERYAIERELGAGGMATVFLAEDLKHRRKVAIKVLRPELAAAVGAERFLHEIETAAQLNHPHIMALYDSGEADGFLYYVMPVAEGESLRTRLLREHQLSIDEAVSLTRQVASALDYAHRRGLIHRDIKPENILLHEGEAVVTDFGIALAISEAGGTRLTETGLSLGTPYYMSPEQSMGDRELDARTDVYALGCVLYEMLAGEPPFTGHTAQTVIARRMTESAPRVSTFRETVPPELDASVARALARAPADRYDSAAGFAAALAAGPTLTGVTAARPAISNHPVRAAAVFGLVSAVALVVVYALMLQLGLPDWVLPAAVVLFIIGLPIIVATAVTERRRAARAGATSGHRWLNWRRALQGGGLAFAGLAVATAGFMALRALGVGPVGSLMAKGVLDARDPILLAEFENRTPDLTLGETIAGGLRVDLSQSGVVVLVPPATVSAALERMLVDPDTRLDEALARQIAEREGLKAVLAGEVSAVGRGYMLTARLVSPDGALLGAERVTADDDAGLIRAIDQLSARMRVRIGESLKDVRASPALDRVTTSSIAALRRFTEAVHATERGDDQVTALPLLQEAVTLDPTFAMAYRKLGLVLQEIGRTEDSHAAFRRAFELRHRLTEGERYLVQAYYHLMIDYDAAQVTAAYRAALALNPDDDLALINLAAHLSPTRQWAERESLAKRAVDVSGLWPAYANLYDAQVLQGKLADAQATVDRLAATMPPGDSRVTRWQVSMMMARGEDAEAEQVLRESVGRGDWPRSAQGDALHWLGDLMRKRGRWREAEQWFRQWMALEYGSGIDFHAVHHLASLQAVRGSVSEAIELLSSYAFDSLPHAERPYLPAALFYTSIGRLDRARTLVAEFERHIDEGVRRQPAYRAAMLEVSGEIAFREGRFDDAISDFRAMNEQTGQCTTCGLAKLAHALLESGQTDSALSVYERAVSLPTSWYTPLWLPSAAEGGQEDYRWLPQAYQRLGELYEARNDTAKAVTYYNEFVELWKDADPVLQPQVAEVRRRIAALTGEPAAPRPIN